MPNPDLSHILPALRALAVPVDDLHLDPENVRKHGTRNRDAVKASLKRFGQRLPLVALRDTGRVLAGNCRLLMARELGWQHIAVVYVDEPDGELAAKAFAIADNRTAELATWNDLGLAEVLAEIQQAAKDDEALAGLDVDLGFDEEEINRFFDRFSAATGRAPAQPATPDAPEPETPTEGSRVRFVHLVFSSAEHDRFESAIAVLQQRYGTRTVSDTVMEAMRHADRLK